MPATTGAKSGSVAIPHEGETSADVWYRVILTVEDLDGLTHTTFRDVRPRTVRLTFATAPTGLGLLLDGQPLGTPLSILGVTGMRRSLGAPSPQTLSGRTYQFDAWSDGGAATHPITTPSGAKTSTAKFREAAGPKVTTPRMVPDGGTFRGSVAVRITSATEGARIAYTLDGTTPTEGSLRFVPPSFTLTDTRTVKARAFRSGDTPSGVVSRSFTKR